MAQAKSRCELSEKKSSEIELLFIRAETMEIDRVISEVKLKSSCPSEIDFLERNRISGTRHTLHTALLISKQRNKNSILFPSLTFLPERQFVDMFGKCVVANYFL
jgi:hypothetical protein